MKFVRKVLLWWAKMFFGFVPRLLCLVTHLLHLLNFQLYVTFCALCTYLT
jgi:hypothetical protein